MNVTDNTRHQVECLIEFMKAEINSGNVTMTGWKLRDKPSVSVAKDGTVTLKIIEAALVVEPEPMIEVEGPTD